MREKTTNIVGEILRGIRPDLKAMRAEVHAEFQDIKTRLTSFEVSVSQLFSLDAAKSQRIDRLEDRVKRLERGP